MDYPKLNEKLERKKSEIEKEIEGIRKGLGKALLILEKHEGAEVKKKAEVEKCEQSARAKPKPERVLAKKEKLESASGRAQAKREFIEGLRAKIVKLKAEKSLIEESVTELRAFDPIHAQVDNPALHADFEFSKKAYRKPNSVFKIFEGRFTPPKYRVMPKADGYFATQSWNRIPIDHCVVDPILIPDWLIEEFKLGEWSDDLSEIQKLVRKNKAIPRLRELFRHVQPLTIYSKKGQLAPNYRFLGIRGFDTESDGKMIYSRYRGEEEESVDGKVVHVHDSAYSALRMTSHAKRGHKEEMALLSATELQIESLQRQLTEIRTDDVDYEERKKEIRGALVVEAEKLKKSTNHHKKSAFRTMLTKIDFKDAKGRENVGATCATWLKAIRLLKARKPQISNKAQYGDEDRQTLELMVAESEALLGLHFNEWGAIKAKLQRMGTTAVFNGSPEERLGKQRENLTGVLFSKITSLRPIGMVTAVRPFLQYSQQVKSQMEKVKKAIWARDLSAAISESENMIALGTVFRTQKGIEEIISELSLNPTTDLGALGQKAGLLMDAISLDGSFRPGSPVSNLKDLVLSTLGGFKNDLGAVTKKNPSGGDRAKALETMKEKLKSLDFAFCLGSPVL